MFFYTCNINIKNSYLIKLYSSLNKDLTSTKGTFNLSDSWIVFLINAIKSLLTFSSPRAYSVFLNSHKRGSSIEVARIILYLIWFTRYSFKIITLHIDSINVFSVFGTVCNRQEPNLARAERFRIDSYNQERKSGNYAFFIFPVSSTMHLDTHANTEFVKFDGTISGSVSILKNPLLSPVKTES